ncbi:WG repeat-containing protein [Maribacter sp. ACAM166]|uniref:WG repeat-containing protein n=1 Tax=Maribacter sp. ACAM166 TaxID=2508996 RepID=UPI0010FCEFA0|nr:WG repeat-containing protein [Maribacter sp. ACAM166]TLP71128.1 WG repeat-containing protein [Maribacter sp. ACAM166]
MRNTMILWVVMLLIALPINAQSLENIDEIAPYSEGLAAVRKGSQWGFINEEGTLVIDFRDDVYSSQNADASKSDISGIGYPMFNEGLCVITETIEDGVPVFGFIDTTGAVVFEPQFLNIYPFHNGYTTGVLFDKTFKGKNEFQLKIYDYKFFDVMLNTSGKVTDYFERRDYILLTLKRYEMPEIRAKVLHVGVVAIYNPEQGWKIKKVQTKN